MALAVSTLLRRASNFLKISPSFNHLKNSFSSIQPTTSSILTSNSFKTQFLKASLPLISQECSFKVKYKLRKRCKDCYMVVRNERTYVLCPTHPRHKQMSMVKKPKYTWVITHACQSKQRPW